MIYSFTPPAVVGVPVVDSPALFPVHRLSLRHIGSCRRKARGKDDGVTSASKKNDDRIHIYVIR